MVGGRWCLAQVLLPVSPHACLTLINPALGANSYLKVMVPKSINVTFWEQQKKKKAVAMVSKFLI
jgi:hypothetical protein